MPPASQPSNTRTTVAAPLFPLTPLTQPAVPAVPAESSESSESLSDGLGGMRLAERTLAVPVDPVDPVSHPVQARHLQDTQNARQPPLLPLPLPPSAGDLPLIGATISILSDSRRYVARYLSRHDQPRSKQQKQRPPGVQGVLGEPQSSSRIWRTRFLFKPTVVTYDADALAALLHPANADCFLAAQGYYPLRLFLHDSLFLQDGPTHDEQKRLMTPAFHSRHFPAYLALMDRVLQQKTREWGIRGQRRFHRDAQDIAVKLAAAAILSLVDGRDRGEQEDGGRHENLQNLQNLQNLRRLHELQNLWTHMQVGINAGDILGRLFFCARHIRDHQIPAFLTRLIQERLRALADGAAPDDVLTHLLLAQEDGHQLSQQNIIDQLVLVIFAGYDTVAATTTWALVELLQHSDRTILERVRCELVGTALHIGDVGDAGNAGKTGNADNADNAGELSYNHLQDTPYTNAVLLETLRLHPVAHVMLRGVAREWDYAGYRIPQGWTVLHCPAYLHRDPRYWADPDCFDPDRFLPPRQEHLRAGMVFRPWGAGAHMCLGMHLSQIEIKAILRWALGHYDLQLLPKQNLRPQYLPAPRPRSGARIAYQART